MKSNMKLYFGRSLDLHEALLRVNPEHGRRVPDTLLRRMCEVFAQEYGF